jgi:hypothetical protein
MKNPLKVNRDLQTCNEVLIKLGYTRKVEAQKNGTRVHNMYRDGKLEFTAGDATTAWYQLEKRGEIEYVD